MDADLSWLLWCPLAEHVLKEAQRVLRLNLLPFDHICEHILVALDEDARVSLPMNELFITISLNTLHERVDLQLLELA